MQNATTNADPSEIAKFSALAARWWDTQSDFKPLHEINPLRLNWINQTAPLAGKQVLDVGCGGGILAESMAVLGASVTGIDLSEKALKVAQLHGLESEVKVTYQLISVEQLAQETPARFDVVTCMEMLEHVPVPASTIKACAELVKPGGYVFFSTLNRNLHSFLFAILGAEYVLKLLPKGTHSYEKFIKPSELNHWAQSAGLTLLDTSGLGYNPFTKKYTLQKETSVNYMMAMARNGQS